MSDSALIDLWRQALTAVATVAGPFILTALVVGLVTAVLQAATQLQENVISFVPKIAAAGLVLALSGPWLLGQLTQYARTTFDNMERVARTGR